MHLKAPSSFNFYNIPLMSYSFQKKIRSEAASEITDFKDLDTTMKTTDSGQVSGGSSIGSHSPPNMEGGTLLPPPRYLLPPKLRPSPGVKMHPLTSVVPAQFKGKLRILFNCKWSEHSVMIVLNCGQDALKSGFFGLRFSNRFINFWALFCFEPHRKA